MSLVQSLSFTSGHVYFVGDLHGQYSLLLKAMRNVRFNPDNGDVLISVGDLVDRGPESLEVLSLLEKDWFYAVKGNHEDMLLKGIEAIEGKGSLTDLWNWRDFNGGDWFKENTADAKQVLRLLPKIKHLPIAIEIQTEIGCIGVVHASVPENNWLNTELLQDTATQKFVMWSRKNGLEARKQAYVTKKLGFKKSLLGLPETDSANAYNHHVTGIDAVVVGHTIMPNDEPAILGNTLYLDVGCAKGAAPVLYRADKLLENLA